MDLTSSISGIEECARFAVGWSAASATHAKTHKNHRNEVIADEQDVIDGPFKCMSLRDGYGT
jgi:hypothetical protein